MASFWMQKLGSQHVLKTCLGRGSVLSRSSLHWNQPSSSRRFISQRSTWQAIASSTTSAESTSAKKTGPSDRVIRGQRRQTVKTAEKVSKHAQDRSRHRMPRPQRYQRSARGTGPGARRQVQKSQESKDGSDDATKRNVKAYGRRNLPTVLRNTPPDSKERADWLRQQKRLHMEKLIQQEFASTEDEDTEYVGDPKEVLSESDEIAQAELDLEAEAMRGARSRRRRYKQVPGEGPKKEPWRKAGDTKVSEGGGRGGMREVDLWGGRIGGADWFLEEAESADSLEDAAQTLGVDAEWEDDAVEKLMQDMTAAEESSTAKVRAAAEVTGNVNELDMEDAEMRRSAAPPAKSRKAMDKADHVGIEDNERFATLKAMHAAGSDEARWKLLNDVADEIRPVMEQVADAVLKDNIRHVHDTLVETHESMSMMMDEVMEQGEYSVRALEAKDKRISARNEKAKKYFERVKKLHQQRDPENEMAKWQRAEKEARSAAVIQKDLTQPKFLYDAIKERGMDESHPHYGIVKEFAYGISQNLGYTDKDKATMVRQMVHGLRKVNDEFGLNIEKMGITEFEVPQKPQYQDTDV